MAALKEYMSKHLNVPFVEVTDANGNKKYLCSNGVLFTHQEYIDGIDLKSEYARRLKEDMLYDYNYARSTGILRKQRGQEDKKAEPEVKKEFPKEEPEESKREEKKYNITAIIILLCTTSVISMYISTLHTATYLKDYTSIISAWLMSAAVTAYNSTAFETGLLFRHRKQYFMYAVFLFLWCAVTLFSMLTTVSVFYDSFNFESIEIAKTNNEVEAKKLELSLLQSKEKDLREAIEFRKKDIEYRQQKEYATASVRKELTEYEKELQENQSRQQEIVASFPQASETDKIVAKEKFFAFISRIAGIKSGILEFIMSTLAAVFINLIAPLSLSAVIELKGKGSLTTN